MRARDTFFCVYMYIYDVASQTTRRLTKKTEEKNTEKNMKSENAKNREVKKAGNIEWYGIVNLSVWVCK